MIKIASSHPQRRCFSLLTRVLSSSEVKNFAIIGPSSQPKVTLLPADFTTPKANKEANIDVLPVVGSEQPLQLPINTAPSLPTDIPPAHLFNGVPENVSTRRVYIYKPAKNAMQSGKQNSSSWRLDFNVEDKWENPLMGWASSADTQQALKVSFATREEAIRFAEKHGYNYELRDEQSTKFVKKVYADNFKPVSGKIRLIRTK